LCLPIELCIKRGHKPASRKFETGNLQPEAGIGNRQTSNRQQAISTAKPANQPSGNQLLGNQQLQTGKLQTSKPDNRQQQTANPKPLIRTANWRLQTDN